ncbi:MAG: 2-amino-4-hydroxy-6-hydroxymethyldihydropteridine diphosphokinase [Hyphomonadaceae bacterium]
MPLEPSGIFIGLGSNLGLGSKSPRDILISALELLSQNGDHVTTLSSFWSTKAWPPNPGKPDYLNAVCRIEPADGDPLALLQRCQVIEAQMNRVRSPDDRWSNRTLDLDVVDYNGIVSANSSVITLPHPRIAERDCVLLPLLEIAPGWRHPVSGTSGRDLLKLLHESGNLNDCVRLDGGQGSRA